jgi:hypothetical protein
MRGLIDTLTERIKHMEQIVIQLRMDIEMLKAQSAIQRRKDVN